MDRDPAACRDMDALREVIDALDAALVALLIRRAACIDRAAELKAPLGIPALVPARVEAVVAHVRALSGEGFDPDEAEALWRHLIAWSIRREEAAFAAGKERP